MSFGLHMNVRMNIPQRFGVLSWKKGTHPAVWVARGSELGAHGPAAKSPTQGALGPGPGLRHSALRAFPELGAWWCVVGLPLMPPSLRFGPCAHALGICKGCGHVVYCCFIFRATLCIKGIETEASQKIATQPSHPCPNKRRQFNDLEAAYFYRELYLS